MGYLFLVNLGPIQSFIASGRRTRDLWFGSVLLSELSKTAARTIVKREGVKSLIFPMPDPKKHEENLSEGSDFAVANKIVAYIESDPGVLGEVVRENVQVRLTALNTRMYEELVAAVRNDKSIVRPAEALSDPAVVEDRSDPDVVERQVRKLIDHDVAQEQIKGLIDCVWVAVEYDKERDTYATKRDKLEQWLDARRNTRNFSSVTYKRNLPKSSISGQLDSVLLPSFYPARNAEPDVKRREALNRYKIFRVGPAEYLSGVDLLKRRGKFEREKKDAVQDTFLSTSHIASIPYLERLERLDADKRLQVKKDWDTYIATILETIPHAARSRDPDEAIASVMERIPDKYIKSTILGQRDGALLFEERLHEDFPDPNDFQKISHALHTFFEHVELPIVQPHPYYAILRADGDGMGKLIDNRAKEGKSFEGHQEVSKKLIAFAARVKEIVEQDHEGTLLYSGGDDVLAFLPLHTVLLCARDLSHAFKETLAFKGEKAQPSLSVGIAIVHHLSLLRDALQQSGRAENSAKDVPGKDALAITLYRRSGEEYSVKGKLEQLDDYLSWLTLYFMPALDPPAPAWQRISLPRGAAYELRDTALRLSVFPANTAKHELEELQEALKYDMLRILKRKVKASVRSSDLEVKKIIRLLLIVFKKRLGISLDQDDFVSENDYELIGSVSNILSETAAIVEIPEFIDELIIAHELADAHTLAKRTREELYERQEQGKRQKETGQ